MVEAYYNYAFHNEAIVCTAETLQILTQAVGAEVLWAFAVVAGALRTVGSTDAVCSDLAEVTV